MQFGSCLTGQLKLAAGVDLELIVGTRYYTLADRSVETEGPTLTKGPPQ